MAVTKRFERILKGINEIGIELSELSLVIRDPEK
jgi:hypothetical protein